MKTTKQCLGCELIKGIEEFSRQNANPDGYRKLCKLCIRKKIPQKREVYIQPNYIKCCACQKKKELEHFYKKSNGRYYTLCKDCNKIKLREYADRKKNVPESKTCKKCNIEKSHRQFNVSKYSSDGLVSKCKSCRKEERKSENSDSKCRVYAIATKNGYNVKIGYTTKKLEKRFRAIQGMCPVELIVIGEITFDSVKDCKEKELWFHNKLRKYRITIGGVFTEWFQMNEYVRILISENFNE